MLPKHNHCNAIIRLKTKMVTKGLKAGKHVRNKTLDKGTVYKPGSPGQGGQNFILLLRADKSLKNSSFLKLLSISRLL